MNNNTQLEKLNADKGTYINKDVQTIRFSGRISKKYKKKCTSIFFFIFSIIYFFFNLIFYLINKYAEEEDKIGNKGYLYIFCIYLIIIAIILPSVYIFRLFYQRFFKYEITDRFIIIHSGVLSRKKVTIPFSRIQNVNIKQDIFDRGFKLFTVKIETAGSSAAHPNNALGRPEGYIPGLEHTEEIEKITNELVHAYTQKPPKSIEGKVFENNDLVFDEFIAYILNKIYGEDSIKTRIKELRKQNNVTQQKLADEIGVTRQTILYLEQGKYVPSLTLAMQIAKFFKIPIEGIFELEASDVDKRRGKME